MHVLLILFILFLCCAAFRSMIGWLVLLVLLAALFGHARAAPALADDSLICDFQHQCYGSSSKPAPHAEIPKPTVTSPEPGVLDFHYPDWPEAPASPPAAEAAPGSYPPPEPPEAAYGPPVGQECALMRRGVFLSIRALIAAHRQCDRPDY
jgi:hypothetical protein